MKLSVRRNSCELHMSAVQPSSVLPAGATDLTNHKLWVKFTGFNTENMNCGISLNPKFETEFSRGISAEKPGFWRIVGYDEGREYIETTHPITAEYMFFFDLEEPTMLWRGEIDKANMKVKDGVVIAQKKRFGIFPYTETLATFTADILSPKEELPDVKVPNFSDQVLVPPPDFIDPRDMRLFPQIFDPEFVDWWFANEDAIARGEKPLERPKGEITNIRHHHHLYHYDHLNPSFKLFGHRILMQSRTGRMERLDRSTTMES
jgi:hypothetical protein